MTGVVQRRDARCAERIHSADEMKETELLQRMAASNTISLASSDRSTEVVLAVSHIPLFKEDRRED